MPKALAAIISFNKTKWNTVWYMNYETIFSIVQTNNFELCSAYDGRLHVQYFIQIIYLISYTYIIDVSVIMIKFLRYTRSEFIILH